MANAVPITVVALKKFGCFALKPIRYQPILSVIPGNKDNLNGIGLMKSLQNIDCRSVSSHSQDSRSDNRRFVHPPEA